MSMTSLLENGQSRGVATAVVLTCKKKKITIKQIAILYHTLGAGQESFLK
jgi:hypothetical protein